MQFNLESDTYIMTQFLQDQDQDVWECKVIKYFAQRCPRPPSEHQLPNDKK